MPNDATYLDAPVSPRSFSTLLSGSASLSLWIASNYDSLSWESKSQTWNKQRPATVSSLSPLVLLLVPEARLHPEEGDGREKRRREDPSKCHVCIWEPKPTSLQAARVLSCVKWGFVGCDRATLPSDQVSRENRQFHALLWGPLEIQDFYLDVINK